MFAFASSHLRISLFAILVVLLLTSSIAFAQSAAVVKTVIAAPQSAWEIEHERLLHEDWADLGHFRRANLALPAPAVSAHRVVLMGDSITEGWRGTLQPEGPEMGAFFTGEPYINRGISGQTTPQMLVRFRQDVINLRPAAVVILAGTNDIAGNTGDTTLETIEDNFATMCELAHVHGIHVVLTSVLPAADYPWRPGLQPAPKIAALNQWLRTYAAAHHHIYLDLYSPMATPQGAMRPDLTLDGVHPNRAGYELMAHLLQPAIDQALKK
jgi:lysophospholipase L1-like esterase